MRSAVISTRLGIGFLQVEKCKRFVDKFGGTITNQKGWGNKAAILEDAAKLM
jgi:hypothetical protein